VKKADHSGRADAADLRLQLHRRNNPVQLAREIERHREQRAGQELPLPVERRVLLLVLVDLVFANRLLRRDDHEAWADAQATLPAT